LEAIMVWALLAKFLISKPPLVQAIVVGLSGGLFAAAAAAANERDPRISSIALLVLFWGVVLGGMFHAGLAYQVRHGWDRESPAPTWLYAVYAVVWVLGLVAALLALFGAGGFKVAALAIVPLVLLAPAAFSGVRLALHRAPAENT
jgi:hypothetical protein